MLLRRNLDLGLGLEGRILRRRSWWRVLVWMRGGILRGCYGLIGDLEMGWVGMWLDKGSVNVYFDM